MERKYTAALGPLVRYPELYWGHSRVMCLYPEAEEQVSVVTMPSAPFSAHFCQLEVGVVVWCEHCSSLLLNLCTQRLSKARQRCTGRRPLWLWSMVLAAARSHPPVPSGNINSIVQPSYVPLQHLFYRRKLKINILKQCFFKLWSTSGGVSLFCRPKEWRGVR